MIHINGRPGPALPGWFPNSLLPCYAFVLPGCIQLDLDQWPPSIQPASYIIILNVDSVSKIHFFHSNYCDSFSYQQQFFLKSFMKLQLKSYIINKTMKTPLVTYWDGWSKNITIFTQFNFESGARYC